MADPEGSATRPACALKSIEQFPRGDRALPAIIAGAGIKMIAYERREARQFCIRFDFMSLYPNKVSSSNAISGPIAARKI
ncbi:MAG: hypothetical protein ABIN99_03320, partial [Nitrosospira sp.]